jgi:hypothetical protein
MTITLGTLTFGNILLIAIMIMVAITFGRLIIGLGIAAIVASLGVAAYGVAYVADFITKSFRRFSNKKHARRIR